MRKALVLAALFSAAAAHADTYRVGGGPQYSTPQSACDAAGAAYAWSPMYVYDGNGNAQCGKSETAAFGGEWLGTLQASSDGTTFASLTWPQYQALSAPAPPPPPPPAPPPPSVDWSSDAQVLQAVFWLLCFGLFVHGFKAGDRSV